MKIHEKYMSRCIQLAKNGLGTTYPNPMVGSVIVCNKRIIGEGWHRKSGSPHAEVHAISSVVDKDLLKEATMYVSLEPCSHFGKTPPCADFIIASGVKKVVIGSLDPNPKVSGKGVQKLFDLGCAVKIGILEKECEELNKRFFKYHQKKRPFIILKWAESLRGFIAPKAIDRSSEKRPVWISNELSRQRVHKMRAEEQAILVGTNTVYADNPALTVRDWEGDNPVRIVIDKHLRISPDATVFDGSSKTILITEKRTSDLDGIIIERIDFSKDLPPQICEICYTHKIQSVIIEGGAKTIQSFIDADLWDEAFVFTGVIEFNGGLKAPRFSGELVSEEHLKDDIVRNYKNSHG